MTEDSFPMAGSGVDIRSSYLFNTSIAGIEVKLMNRQCSFIKSFLNTENGQLSRIWSYSIIVATSMWLEIAVLFYNNHFDGVRDSS